MFLVDFSKALDIFDLRTLVHNMHALKFSNSSLKWLLSYLDNRFQFVQVDNRASELKLTTFVVAQGSTLWSVLFNFYVTDLQHKIKVLCFQYADTTILASEKPNNRSSLEAALSKDLQKN